MRVQRAAELCLLGWGVGEQLDCPRQEGGGCLVALPDTGQIRDGRWRPRVHAARAFRDVLTDTKSRKSSSNISSIVGR